MPKQDFMKFLKSLLPSPPAGDLGGLNPTMNLMEPSGPSQWWQGWYEHSAPEGRHISENLRGMRADRNAAAAERAPALASEHDDFDVRSLAADVHRPNHLLHGERREGVVHLGSVDRDLGNSVQEFERDLAELFDGLPGLVPKFDGFDGHMKSSLGGRGPVRLGQGGKEVAELGGGPLTFGENFKETCARPPLQPAGDFAGVPGFFVGQAVRLRGGTGRQLVRRRPPFGVLAPLARPGESVENRPAAVVHHDDSKVGWPCFSPQCVPVVEERQISHDG